MLYWKTISTALVAVIWLAGFAFSQSVAVAAEAERVRELEAMIDALANRSLKSPPQMFKSKSGDEERPLFNEPYDVDEQQRVRKTLLELNKHVGNDLWPLLITHANDKRYAYTIEGDYYSKNTTVGSLCSEMAYMDLLLAYRKYLPDLDDLSHAQPERPYSRYPNLWPDKLLQGGFVKWAEQHPERAMYEAQIAVCEWAIKEAPSLKGVSDEKKAKFVADLTKQFTTLKETKQPVVETGRFKGESFTFVSAKYAENLRKRYENMKKAKK
ncbi:MAG: hypothetical protein AABP62_19800 [Planctomycetota bacterium]